MTPQRWQQIEEVFQSALDLAPAERESFILECCADDDELKREVERLLSQYDEADDFIESPVWTDSRLFNSSAKREIASSLEKELPLNGDDPMLGKRIGVFRLTRELGRGGMGAVYL
ncbi:MAG TPA: hypothetical protein VEX64_09985, partial [Pyrinomonadaceae bacterium]|nr:hypothetical protein [Pyrinomonadaceae bacterium]